MNLDEAIERHTAWKVVFRMAIEQRKDVDAATIGRDDCCTLGKWLHGDGRVQYGERPLFSKLVGSHANFHRNAGAVADAINAKRYDEAEKLLGVWSEYSDASLDVIDTIEALKQDMLCPAPD